MVKTPAPVKVERGVGMAEAVKGLFLTIPAANTHRFRSLGLL
jgi:hypothetical protein